MDLMMTIVSGTASFLRDEPINLGGYVRHFLCILLFIKYGLKGVVDDEGNKSDFYG